MSFNRVGHRQCSGANGLRRSLTQRIREHFWRADPKGVEKTKEAEGNTGMLRGHEKRGGLPGERRRQDSPSIVGVPGGPVGAWV